jgi:hypothetical protein
MPDDDVPADSLPKPRTDRIFATAGDWAVGADGLQWILFRRRSGGWRPVSFVRSTRDVLARCMREKGVEPGTAAQLLSGLPETFDQWKANQSTARSGAFDMPVEAGAGEPPAGDSGFERADHPDPADVMAVLMGPAALPGLAVSPGAPIGPTGPAG